MTRSEERLRVGTETREAGRARLRKYVVTEHQQVSVPVSREEVTLEHEPVTARLQRELPVGCTAARLSGDEFSRGAGCTRSAGLISPMVFLPVVRRSGHRG
jgi:hypothetical protein